jgi:type IV pilus assembly protein PilW
MSNLRQKGFSLIELMIALTIGMFLVLGVLYIYSSSRASYATNDAGARVQEDGRFALERLTREIRMAGYMGCASGLSNPNVIADPVKYPITFILGDGINIFDGGTAGGWVNPTAIVQVANTDVIVIKGMGSCTAALTGNMGTDNANIQIGVNVCGWAAEDVLIISDCISADVFAATNVSTGSVTIAHSNAENTTPKLSRPYGTDAIVGRYQETTFFVGVTPEGQPALYELQYNGKTYGVPQAVAGNVYDLQARVNLDTDADGDVDSADQAPASTNWNQTVSVELNYSVRSEDGTAGTVSQTYPYNGANVTDRRIRRDFGSVVAIRNRLP